MATHIPGWLSATAASVTQAANATQTQTEIETLQTAQTDLSDLTVQFQRLAEADALGRGTWWEGQTAEPGLFHELAQASANPQPRVLNSLLRQLQTFAASVDDALIAAWRTHAASRMGNVAELQSLATTLAGIQGVAALAASLQDVLGRLARVQTQAPSQQSLAFLEQAEQRLDALEAALQPAAVRLLLSAVARGGASLTLLTDDVRKWLDANGAEKSFRIVAGAPERS